ncbi:two-component system, chemotaxis family, chemotaxis protein CheY [Azospirillaceae bacterium]
MLVHDASIIKLTSVTRAVFFPIAIHAKKRTWGDMIVPLNKRYNFTSFSILVVDDNLYMRRIVREMLRSFGVGTVLEAANGRHALNILRENEVDLVISNWLMEPMDGIEMTRVIRTARNSQHRTKPVVLVTAYTESHRVITARNAGVTEFLAKPVSANALLARILAVVERPRVFVSTPNFNGPDRRRQSAIEYPAEKDRRSTRISDSPSPTSNALDENSEFTPRGPGLTEEEIVALMKGLDPTKVLGAPEERAGHNTGRNANV